MAKGPVTPPYRFFKRAWVALRIVPSSNGDDASIRKDSASYSGISLIITVIVIIFGSLYMNYMRRKSKIEEVFTSAVRVDIHEVRSGTEVQNVWPKDPRRVDQSVALRRRGAQGLDKKDQPLNMGDCVWISDESDDCIAEKSDEDFDPRHDQIADDRECNVSEEDKNPTAPDVFETYLPTAFWADQKELKNLSRRVDGRRDTASAITDTKFERSIKTQDTTYKVDTRYKIGNDTRDRSFHIGNQTRDTVVAHSPQETNIVTLSRQKASKLQNLSLFTPEDLEQHLNTQIDNNLFTPKELEQRL